MDMLCQLAPHLQRDPKQIGVGRLRELLKSASNLTTRFMNVSQFSCGIQLYCRNCNACVTPTPIRSDVPWGGRGACGRLNSVIQATQTVIRGANRGIRRFLGATGLGYHADRVGDHTAKLQEKLQHGLTWKRDAMCICCLLYTSDAADE